MERAQTNMAIRSVFTVGFLVVLALFGGLLVPELKIRGLRKQSAFAKAFPAKSAFVELNGAYCRMAGRRLCNGTFRNGQGLMLTGCTFRDVRGHAASAVGFSEWLKGLGARYLYVQAPAKADRNGTLHPQVMEHHGNEMADAFLAEMARCGVPTLDLREALAETPEDVLRHFYRTDHHWNNDAVFRAFGMVAGRLAEMTSSDVAAVQALTDRTSWEREVWPDCLWGSRGRRTGRLFSGVDDLIVYTPRFETQMSLEVPSKGIARSGSFRKANMWRAQDIRKSGRLEKDAYSYLYVGGLYPMVRHHNAAAPVQAKVMIIGDSFARPLEALLSTVVSDLVVVDPRRFAKGEKVSDHVLRQRPEIVLQLINTGGFFSDFIGRKASGRPVMFDYGIPTVGAK